jgi:4-amino-4-deoxy-L-arabinose transferase-like glycosyltransferase
MLGESLGTRGERAGPAAAERSGTASGGRGRRALAVEVAAVALTVALALGLALFRLPSLPDGLHGDEAVTGLEAWRILREGYIGPYSPSALGQPSGPLYTTALSVWLLGETILALRLPSAVAGALATLALYLAMRRPFGVPTALLGAAMFALLPWRLHLSRVGFPVAWWPLAALLAAWALVVAVRREGLRWWALAGALAGLGVYVYNAHLLLLAALLGFAAVHAAAAGRRRPGRAVAQMGALLTALALVASPMLLYALSRGEAYASHFQLVSVLGTEEWRGLRGPVERFGYLASRYARYWPALASGGRADYADGTGIVPLVPWWLLGLAGGGLALALRARRPPLALLAAALALLLPLGSALSTHGLARRTYAVAPFLALLAALPIGALLERRGLWLRRGAGAVLAAAALLALGARATSDYFVWFAASGEARWTFARELVDASRYMGALPDDSYVYFLSERWGFDYETRLFLAPDVAGESRGREGEPLSLEPDPSRGRPVWVLLGGRKDLLPELQHRYPGGTVRLGPVADTTLRPGGAQPTFAAYEAPP